MRQKILPILLLILIMMCGCGSKGNLRPSVSLTVPENFTAILKIGEIEDQSKLTVKTVETGISMTIENALFSPSMTVVVGTDTIAIDYEGLEFNMPYAAVPENAVFIKLTEALSDIKVNFDIAKKADKGYEISGKAGTTPYKAFFAKNGEISSITIPDCGIVVSDIQKLET